MDAVTIPMATLLLLLLLPASYESIVKRRESSPANWRSHWVKRDTRLWLFLSCFRCVSEILQASPWPSKSAYPKQTESKGAKMFILIEIILKRFRQPEAVRFILLVAVHFSHIFHTLSSAYDAEPAQSAPNAVHNRAHDWSRTIAERAPASSTTGRHWRKNPVQERGPPSPELCGRQQQQPTSNRLKPFAWFRRYNTVSTTYMCYAVLRSSLPLDRLVALYDPVRPHCYLPGHFVIYRPMATVFSFVFGICHLAWRLVQHSLQRPLRLYMIFFMIQTDATIRHQIQLFGSEHVASRLVGLSKRGQLTKLDEFLHKIMYYPIRYRSQIVYKIRPNRTLQSRQLIADQVAKCALVCICLFMSLFWIIFPTVLWFCLIDKNYVITYPGCEPELDQSVKSGKSSSWSMTILPHRIIAFIFDTMENVFIWADSGFALAIVLPLAYLLNHDILIYWRHLHTELDQLLYRVKLDHIIQEFAVDSANKPANNPLDWTPPHYEYNEAEDYYAHSDKLGSNLSSSSSCFMNGFRQYTETRDTENRILEVQAKIDDFFRQIEMTDLFVSDLISASIIIWLVCFAILTYASVVHVVGFVPLFLRLYEFMGFIFFTTSTFSLLSLHRRTMASYHIIVSLMAFDRSKYKHRFLKILEYYTGRNRSSYTVFHQRPFLATTYLSIIGWTLSCLFLIENLFKGH